MKSQIAEPTALTSPVSGRTTLRRPEQGVVAWLRLMRVYHKIQHATTEEMRREGISVGQFDVLVQVGAAEGATQQEVADALLVTKSNVCQLLDRMERAGLVERRPHGRTNLLYLTTEGKQLHDRIVPAHERCIAEHFAALTTDEQAALSGLLRKLDHSLP